nr:MAG TPA: hypothetical protein [Caudoviricetes sp.]
MVEKCCEKAVCRGIHVTAGVWYRNTADNASSPESISPLFGSGAFSYPEP